MRVDAEAGILISCVEIVNQTIIHRYSFEGERLLSFCETYAVEQNIDVRIEQVFAGGAIDIDKRGVIYFTQMTPYEIRRFSVDGELLTRIYRENSFMRPPRVKEEGSSMTFEMAPASYSIVVLNDNKFINTVQVPKGSGERSETIIDLYDGDGRLLASESFNRSIQLRCKDQAGNVYAINYDEHPSVVKYRVVF
jgi:hypothetical protein